MLYGSVKADMALTGGVHSATDVVTAMMAGAKVAMMTSALLKRGITFLDTLSTELLVVAPFENLQSGHRPGTVHILKVCQSGNALLKTSIQFRTRGA